MDKLANQYLIIGVAIFFASCATSMSPVKVNNTLPTLTKSKFISQSQAEEAIKLIDVSIWLRVGIMLLLLD